MKQYCTIRNVFFDIINRGGLCKPSDALYITTVHAQEFLDHLFDNQSTKSCILSNFSNPRAVFIHSFIEKLETCSETGSLCNIKLENGHSFTKFSKVIARKIFNIGGKNYANDENSKIHQSKKCKRKSTQEVTKSQSVMKITKLQSDRI